MGWVRVSPGVYKDSSSGQVVHSATTPGGAAPSKPGQPGKPRPAPSGSSSSIPASLGKINTGSPGGAIQGQYLANTAFGTQQSQMQNPNVNTAFGGQQITYDANGRPTVNQTLSQPNQAVLGGIQGNAQNANTGVGNLLGQNVLGSLTGQGTGGAGNMNPYEQATYGQLTQGLNTNYGQAQRDFQQQEANKGIPTSSDAYGKDLLNFQNAWQPQFQNAANQAVTTGTNLGLSTLGQLSQLGQQGFYQPQFQQFQGAQTVNPNVANVGIGYGNLNVAQQNASTAKGQLAVNQGYLGNALANTVLGAQTTNPTFA